MRWRSRMYLLGAQNCTYYVVNAVMFPRSKVSLSNQGGSPGRVVMWGDTCSKGHGFESQHHMMDGCFSHLFVVKIVVFVSKDENKRNRGQEWLIFKCFNVPRFKGTSKEMKKVTKLLLWLSFDIKKWAILCLFRLFKSEQFLVKIADDWIRTRVVCCLKQPLC